jgi:hypothetical protein
LREKVGAKFRFQDLKTWQLTIEIAGELLEIADQLKNRNFSDLLIC